MLEEERIRCQGAERRATEVDQRRQDAEQRVHKLEEAIQEAEGAVLTLTQEKTGKSLHIYLMRCQSLLYSAN